jgi:hypothetical protein
MFQNRARSSQGTVALKVRKTLLWIVLCFVGVALVAVLTTCEFMPDPIHLEPLSWRFHPDPDPPSKPEQRTRDRLRVLFIGNSFTSRNGGQARILRALAASANIQPPPIIEETTLEGSSLQEQWDVKLALPRIREGNWDFIVLQDLSIDPLVDQKDMFDYARKFDAEIRKAGAHTVLFMTWPLRTHPQDGAEIYSQYEELGKSISAGVVPNERAWANARKLDPDLHLYESDGKHPSESGSYLTACLFYTMLFHASPVGLSSSVTGGGNSYISLDQAQALELQRVAEATATLAPPLPRIVLASTTRPQPSTLPSMR